MMGAKGTYPAVKATRDVRCVRDTHTPPGIGSYVLMYWDTIRALRVRTNLGLQIRRFESRSDAAAWGEAQGFTIKHEF